MQMGKNCKVMMLFLLLSTICLSILMTACEEEAKIRSSWRDREVCVDGKDQEWQGCPQYYDEDTRTLISLLNDENCLFIRLSSHKREIQRQILVQGLTLWFDQNGEKKRKIGVHFPVGVPRKERMRMSRGTSKERQDLFSALLEKGQGEIQLLGPEEYEQITMPVNEIRNYNIDVKINRTERNLVYELKMPITKTEENRHAFLHPGKEGFRLGFQTGDTEKKVARPMGHQTPSGSGSPEGGMGRGSRGGGGRGKPGGMEGGMRGGPPSGKGGRPQGGKVEPFQIWLAVSLAEKSWTPYQENR